MKVRPLIISLCFVLIAVLSSPGQDQPHQQSPLPQSLTAASNNKGLTEELLRIQAEMSQIAQDMDAIDAQMMLGIANKPLVGTARLVPQAHELLKGHRDRKSTRLNSSHSQIS